MKKYSKYKDTNIEWIGEIPEHWNYTRLVNLGSFTASGIDKKINDNEEKVKIINFTDIYSNTNNLLSQEREYMEVTAPVYKVEEHQVAKGDLIFLPSSETFEDLGLSALVDEDLPNTAFSYHVIRFQFDKPFDHRFKKYLTNNYNLLNYFSSEGKGTTRKILNRDSFKNAHVPIPPLSEQTQISSYLDNKTSLIDKLINNNKKLIKLLEEKRTALINQVITKGLDPNVKMKDSGIEWIGEIPEHWKVGSLKWFSQIYSGGTPSTSNPDYWENGNIPWVNSGAVNQRIITKPSKYITEEGLNNSSTKYVQIDSLLMALAGQGRTKGTIAITKIKTTCNQSLGVIQPDSRIFHKYLYYFLDREYFRIRGLAGDSLRDGLNLTVIGEIPILVSSLKEQSQIANFLDEETSNISKVQNSLMRKNILLKEYRQSLISNVITGKIDVQE